ncbi:hypothetical protein GR160_13330 [Flavobacterium sp. Sd200]|uniref:LamG domain-containing protein n=1 Tax=Flavobacterium sp. Sd200 TaxID=2692211 RepID=UPI00136B0BA4|nr:LamG domain-containing protein [Flavobacterium sp. Sd200]MXN92208.1 hypothetical protein [Flavobacterium sp. Sd200]
MGRFKNIFAIALLVVLVYAVSCQNDAVSENSTAALTQESELTALLTSISVSDNITRTVIDSTSCFYVKLPVEVIANGQHITVNSSNDYVLVEEALQNNTITAADVLTIVFPVTIVYANHTEIVVNNEAQYRSLVDACNDNAHYIRDCVAINYPITVFSYNSRLQRENTYMLNNDEELYSVLLNIGANEYYSISYPVTLTVAGQEVVSANSNIQLQQVITTAIDACDQGPVDPEEPCDNPAILTDGLKLYMPFSGNVNDLKGSVVTAPNDTVFVDDRSGNSRCAISFNGNQSLRVTSSADNAIKDGDELSISLWFRMQNTDQSNFEVLFAKGSGGTNGFYLSVYDGNTPMFGAANFQQIWDINWNQTSALHTDTTNWHHVVITLTSTYEAKIYRDGVLQNTQQFEYTNIGANALDYYIGQDFRGWIDDLRVYNRVLSPADVQTLFNIEGECNTCLD